MKTLLIVGEDQGNYSFSNNSRIITLSDFIDFTPSIEKLLLVYNETQGEFYYSLEQKINKCSLNNNVINLDEYVNALKEGDILIIKFLSAPEGFDENLKEWLVSVQNPPEKSAQSLEKETFSGTLDKVYKLLKSDDFFRNLDVSAYANDTGAFSIVIIATWDDDADDPTDGQDYDTTIYHDITAEALSGVFSGNNESKSERGSFIGMPKKVFAQVSLTGAGATSILRWRKYNFK